MLAPAAARAAVHAVRVQIIPAPRSLADSREFLRVLQNYGEITTYRWLKHDNISSAPNTAMAIFSDGDAMRRFVRDCPLTFEISRSEREEAALIDPLNEDAESSEANNSATSDEVSQTNRSSRDSRSKASAGSNQTSYLTRRQHFRINADIWQGNHREWLERHPFWGSFKLESKSMVNQDLQKRVPLVGLSDINANDKYDIPLRILHERREDLEKMPTLKEMVRDLRGEGKSQAQQRQEESSGLWG